MRHVIYIGTPTESNGNHQQGGESFSWQAPDREILKRQQKEKLAAQGRELWAELHSTVTIETLPKWEEKIPNYSCKCKEFYTAWKASNPPRREDFFAWTVELHNAVNAKLENPIITLQQAREIWMT